MESLKDSHWQVGKRILKYIGTIGYDILYSITSNDFLLDILTMILQVVWMIGRVRHDMFSILVKV